MSGYPHIRLDIPDREAFAEGASPIPVPHNVVYYTIDVLLGCPAQWRTEAHSQPDEEAWAALMAAASQALAGLVAAYGAHRAGLRRPETSARRAHLSEGQT
jgi:hypothetical protein